MLNESKTDNNASNEKEENGNESNDKATDLIDQKKTQALESTRVLRSRTKTVKTAEEAEQPSKKAPNEAEQTSKKAPTEAQQPSKKAGSSTSKQSSVANFFKVKPGKI